MPLLPFASYSHTSSGPENEDANYVYFSGDEETAQEKYGPKVRTDESWDDGEKAWMPVVACESVFFPGVSYRRKKSRA